LMRWGQEWAQIVRDAMRAGEAAKGYDADIIGQAILGAIHQSAIEGFHTGRKRQEVIDSLTLFLVRALRQ